MKLRIATSVATAAILALGVSPERRRINDLTADIRRRFPLLPLGYGVDAKGPWARLGEFTARARPDCEAALRAVVANAEQAQP